MKEVKQFQTESKELLNLMINSIYTNKEIFLRELLSNASDAIDKYKYAQLTNSKTIPSLEYGIRISVDKKNNIITISDNGIGMNRESLINNLGTIAKSGSKEFMSKIKEAKKKDANIDIIGQFGVGFYSAFMVANKVEVHTKTLDDKGYLFTSDGVETYSIEEKDKETTGTDITIHLKKDTKEEFGTFLEDYKIEELVKKYSDYIRYPIKMMQKKSRPKLDKDGKAIEGKFEEVLEDKTLNSMIPLWKKNKNEVSEEELNKFYKEKFSDYEDPLFSLFIKVDGVVSYNALLFVPSHAPYDLYSENYEKGLKLFTKGIFIKDKTKELIPDYLKFVKGLVDSDELNLNISREMLQHSPIMQKIADNIEKKVIDKLKDIKKNDIEKYEKFWKIYGEHIKFGIYSSYGSKKELLQDTLVFQSLNNDDKYISLKEYVEKMVKDQKAIYYASGSTIESIKLLPQIEKYKKDGKDVLLMSDKIDEFMIMMMREYDKKEFKSISADNSDDLTKEEKEKVDNLVADHKRLLDTMKEALNGQVDDVGFSTTLVDAPVSIVTKNGMSLEMEKTLSEQPGNNDEHEMKASKVLSINPDHELFKALTTIENNDEEVKEYASLLYEEAMLLEGYEIKDKQSFVKKMNDLFLKALKK